ncbi:Cysteine-rich receptor-like protein kinase 37 [Acorus calamus]|uniref:Cysteine-rich receptor-like protein kinase 37 n=1 Tax=Acorus calamus TaxID=4465 RepID=A0AAV9F0M4_ACOCL|nr:Cysteine-rich receptor-like protein kinase 37 [Acorus calamus]
MLKWGHINTTHCCSGSLDNLSRSLASHANQTQELFLNRQNWSQCEPQYDQTHAPSIAPCNFDEFYNGSSICSTKIMTNLTSNGGKAAFDALLANCSQFGISSSTPSSQLYDGHVFEDACSACKSAMSYMIDNITKSLGVSDNHTEVEICTLAVVVAFTARQIKDDVLIGDFYRCLSALDREDSANNEQWSGLYRFSIAEIDNAISYYSPRLSLGSGSAGRVFKGVLPSGQIVAIKQIYKSAMSDSFTREVEGLSRIRHPNLVCLFGE